LKHSTIFAYCQLPGYEALCSGKQVAVRISFANFSFFFTHALVLFWCTWERDFRAGIHTGLWFWKILAWGGAIAGFFFVPANAITVYAQVSDSGSLRGLGASGTVLPLKRKERVRCYTLVCRGLTSIPSPAPPTKIPHARPPAAARKVARYGAGLFLVFVMIEMVSWVYDVNEWLLRRDSKPAWAALVLGAAVSILGGLALIGAAYYFYAATPACHLNLFFITWSIVVGFALVGVLFVPNRLEVAGLMTSGAVFAYCSYLLYSALGRVPGDACVRVAVSDQWVQVRTAPRRVSAGVSHGCMCVNGSVAARRG
jgi:hypothetical protein